MKKLLLAAAIAVSATPAHAIYTECTMAKEIGPANRPGGSHEPRLGTLEKGMTVAIRDRYQDWVYVTYTFANTDKEPTPYQYGWVRRSDLMKCVMREGTP